MLSNRLRLVMAPILIAVLMAPTTALGGSVSSGGPWSWSRGGITAKFVGSHGSQNDKAYARTEDYNGYCANLRARLKFNPGSVDSGWYESTGYPPAFLITTSTSGTTAVASEHSAQHNWDLTWSSGVQRPHAW